MSQFSSGRRPVVLTTVKCVTGRCDWPHGMKTWRGLRLILSPTITDATACNLRHSAADTAALPRLLCVGIFFSKKLPMQTTQRHPFWGPEFYTKAAASTVYEIYGTTIGFCLSNQVWIFSSIGKIPAPTSPIQQHQPLCIQQKFPQKQPREQQHKWQIILTAIRQDST